MTSASDLLASAHAAEQNLQISNAIKYYEQAMAIKKLPASDYLNLVYLYAHVLDPGHNIPAGIEGKRLIEYCGQRIESAWRRIPELYPDDPEAAFWFMFIAWFCISDPLTLEQCQDLAAKYPEHHAPWIGVFLRSNGSEGRERAMEAYVLAQSDSSYRAGYVESILEAHFGRRRARSQIKEPESRGR